MILRYYIVLMLLVRGAGAVAAAPSEGKAGKYSEVHAIFAKHCLACQDWKEAEGGLVLETRESILAGGDDGAAIVPGSAGKSVLVRQIERREKPFMPPPKKGEKLRDAEIATIRSWIDAGASKAKAGEVAVAAAATTTPTTPRLPHIEPNGTPRRAVPANGDEPQMELVG